MFEVVWKGLKWDSSTGEGRLVTELANDAKMKFWTKCIPTKRPEILFWHFQSDASKTRVWDSDSELDGLTEFLKDPLKKILKEF